MEQKLPKQEGQDAMTLWDKEDMAVRMVLEEGKLNMCLRVLQVRTAALSLSCFPLETPFPQQHPRR